MDWHELASDAPPDDGAPLLLCLPFADGDGCYVAAYVNELGELEPLNGGTLDFSPTHWARIIGPEIK